MKKGFKPVGIRKKLVRYVSLYVILPLFVIIVLLSAQAGVYMRRQTLTANETYAAQLATNIDQLVEIVNYATSKLLVNQQLLADMRTVNRSGLDDYEWYVALRRLSQQVEDVESSIMNAVSGKLILLTRNNYIIHYTQMGEARQDYVREDWYLRAQDSARRPVYTPDIGVVFQENPAYRRVPQDNDALYYARSIMDYSGDVLGAVLVQISSDKIWQSYLNAAVKDTALCIVDQDGVLQMYSGPDADRRFGEIEGIPQLLSLSPGQSATGTSKAGDYYRVTRLSNSPNLLVCLQPTEALFAANRHVMTIMLCAVVGLAMLILLVFGKLAGRITRPITAMAESMDNSPETPVSPMDTRSSLLELNKLAESYNHAWARVQQLLEQVREETRLREETYYEMLMSQISPHFICNTVNSIRYLAAEAEPALTVEALEALGDILQSVYDNKSDITFIAREVQLLSSYVKIMRMRFGYHFQYTENIPFELYMCEIPTFTLQPLVENAILHGVLDKQAGQIVVSAEATDSAIQISVFNNARCDDIESVRRALREQTHSRKQFTGIGLYNINARLNMLYGPEFGLTFDERQESGFEVVVHLPRKEVSLDAEDADR